MSLSRIQAVTFDAAHTLFHPYPSVGAIYREVMARHGLHYAEAELENGFRNAFRSVAKDAAILDGEARERSYWRSVVQTSIAGLQPQPADFEALFAELWDTFAHGERWRVDPAAVEVLATLRNAGLAVALLTNWDHRVRQVVAESVLAESFDHLFISSEIGFEKPDPRIFRHVENALGLASGDLLHVGDSFQHDIEGALQAGWKAIRLASDALSPDARYPTIAALADLPRFLGL